MYAVLEETARAHAGAPALHQPIGKGKYRTYNWTEYRDAVREVACGLDRLGIRKGDIVALYSETRAEFYLADLGIMSRGAIAAALYTSYPVHELIKNLRNCRPRAVFCENAKGMQALVAAGGEPALTEHWITLLDEAAWRSHFRRVARDGPPSHGRRLRSVSSASARSSIPPPTPILYLTSGATGEPKMGLVTHDALVTNIDQGPAVLPLHPYDTTIAFLPSAHIAQRVVWKFCPSGMPLQSAFPKVWRGMPSELKTIRPIVFAGAAARLGAHLRQHQHGNPQEERRSPGSCFMARSAWARKPPGCGRKASRCRDWMQTSLKVADQVGVFENPGAAGRTDSHCRFRRGAAGQGTGAILRGHRHAADRRLRAHRGRRGVPEPDRPAEIRQHRRSLCRG